MDTDSVGALINNNKYTNSVGVWFLYHNRLVNVCLQNISIIALDSHSLEVA